MSDQRYDTYDGFIFHDRYEPYPNRNVALIVAAKKYYSFTARNSVDARRGLRGLSRQCGGNAVLNTETEYIPGQPGYYRSYGIPALYARPSYAGKFTKSQLQASFKELVFREPQASIPKKKATYFDYLLFSAYAVEAIFAFPLVIFPAILLTIAYLISDLFQPLVRSKTSAIPTSVNRWTLDRFRTYPFVSLASLLFALLLIGLQRL